MMLPKPITLQEVYDLAEDWFHGVASDESGESSARLFRHPDARIHGANGQTFTLEEHRRLHTKWTDEKHLLGTLHLAPLSDDPPRVRAMGTVYWEAKYSTPPPSGPSVIKAVAGEDWIIERLPDGRLCFVLYWSNFYHPLSDSAPIRL